MIKNFAVSLGLTLIIELTLSIIMGIRNKKDIKVVILANTLTNPVVVYIAICIKVFGNDLIYNIVIPIVEILVVVVEYWVFKKYLDYKGKPPLLISAVNNVTSYLIGVLFF